MLDQRGKMRTAAFVTAGTIVVWFALSRVGDAIGIPAFFEFLLDLALLAEIFWAIAVVVRAVRAVRAVAGRVVLDPRGKMRTAAFVTAGTIVVWFALSRVGDAIGIPAFFEFLLDLALLAEIFWAIAVIVRAGRAWHGLLQGREQGDA